MRDYKVRYRTFDQLLDAVADDFSTYDKNSLIEPSQLIKIAKKVNKQMLMRVTKTKQCIVKYENFVARLPLDFLHMNFAVYIQPYKKTVPNIQGTQTENVSITTEDLDLLSATKEIYITENGDMYDIVERKSYTDYHYKVVSRVAIKENEDILRGEHCDVTGELKGEFIKMNMSSGYLYINYEGMLEDDEGNLLVVDHELVNDYYEYSLKRRILENIMMNGEEATMMNKMNVIEQRWRASQREALSVANMFDYGELEETMRINRTAAFKRYYSMFI
jgi:hypothetical protein